MAASLAPLDNDCNLHLGMLRTVYRFLNEVRILQKLIENINSGS